MAALFLAAYFLFAAFCLFTDQKWFLGKRAKALKDEKRKKFRRVQALEMLLCMIWLLVIFLTERVMGLDLMQPDGKRLLIGSGVCIILVVTCVEYFYYKKINKEESL